MPLGPLDGMKLPSASRQNGGYQKTSALCPEEHSGREAVGQKKPRNTQRGTVRITYREVALRVCMPVGRADTSLQRCLNCGARQGKESCATWGGAAVRPASGSGTKGRYAQLLRALTGRPLPYPHGPSAIAAGAASDTSASAALIRNK
jgi:hypothetical protein